MAREPKPPRRPTGPGRPAKRPRTGARSASAPPAPAAGATPASAPSAPARLVARIPRPRRGLVLTRRALVFFAVLALLVLSYAASLKVFVTQQADLATANRQIVERTARVADLEDELERWRDPAYVKAQARTRLGWVMPGEVGYRVIGHDGEVLSGNQEIEGVGAHTPSGFDPRWWDRLAASLRDADSPVAP